MLLKNIEIHAVNERFQCFGGDKEFKLYLGALRDVDRMASLAERCAREIGERRYVSMSVTGVVFRSSSHSIG
jgi:hypothetical protein